MEFSSIEFITAICLGIEGSLNSVDVLDYSLDLLDSSLVLVIFKGNISGRGCRKLKFEKNNFLAMRLVVKLKSIIKGICTCTQKDTILVAVSVTYVLVVLLPLSFIIVLYKFLTGPKKPHTKVF